MVGRSLFYAALLAFTGSLHPARANAQDGGARPASEMPVRDGVVVVKVRDYDAARLQLLQAMKQEAADFVDSRTEVNPKGKKHGWMRFRLDTRQITEALPAIHQVGKLY